ncbi:MAG: FAD-binding oxidoreductase [Proteobacteria bacterium]|nr:FAD-binding oxidoreductase [Pseudomonadota bacterium]
MRITGSTRRRFLTRALMVAGATAVGLLQAPISLGREVGAHLARIKGRIIMRMDPDYPQWWSSMSWYMYMPKRYPDLIVRAKSEQDILSALAYAREKKLKVTVRSGGHNPAKAVLRDGGMLLDLSRLRKVEIDAAAQTAWVEPGIHGEKLVAALAKQGLDFPAAHTGIVPIGGYIMGGGLGWNMPERDIACRSILAAEVITADGRKLTASANENSDLWWAIRGCGPGFFGVVMRYKLQVYPLYHAMTKSKYLFAIDKLPQVCKALEKVAAAKKEQLEVLAVVGRFYPPDKPPAERDLVCAVSIFAFANSEKEASALMAPWASSGLPAQSLMKRENRIMDYEQLFSGQETDFSSPNRTAVENIWTDDVSKGLQALAKKMLDDPPPSPRCFALSAWGFSNTREDATSCVSTPAPHYLSWYLMAEDESHLALNRRWMDESVELLRPVTRGHYINEIDPQHYPQHVAECFSPESWKRLAKLRKQHDPDGVFYSWLGHGDQKS